MRESRQERIRTFLLLLPGIGYIGLLISAVMGTTVLQSLGLFNLTGSSGLTLRFWAALFDRQFLDSLLYSVYIGVASSLGSLLICYPLALYLFAPFPGKPLLLPVGRLPLFVPALVATFLIINLMDYHGVLNAFLQWIGLIKEPLRLRNDRHAIGVLIIQLWKNVPFQLVIMTSALESVRTDVKEAARNLGAGPLALFRHIILPLTVPSALVAVILVFIGTFGDFAISSTAGPLYPMSLSVLMHTRAYRFQEWNLSACVGVMMIITTVVFVLLYTRLGASLRETEGGAPRRRGR